MKLTLPRLPKTPRFSLHVKTDQIKNIILFPVRHIVSILILFSLTAFVAVAIWYRGYLLSTIKTTAKKQSHEFSYSGPSNATPTLTPSPTSSPTPTDTTVLGTSSYSGSDTVSASPTPIPPPPKIVPQPTIQISTTNSQITNTGSGNPNCTTAANVPNAWYSDVYPNPPISTNTGSVTMVVTIRDCNQNTAPVSDNVTISLSSGDPNTRINGNNLPYSLTTQGGQASFTVASQVTGTVKLVVQDTSKSFTVTDINNNNPVITFTSGSSSSNQNCTTQTGVPNAWYSDVYPASPVSSTAGSSVTFTVDIRDCNKNNASVSDSLTISQTSSDSSFTVNGSPSPVSVQAQNGHATFTVSSKNTGTDTFTVKDITSSFTITDVNNNNPSVSFSPSSTVTPTPTTTPTSTPTPTTSVTVTPTLSQSTPTPTPAPSSTPTPPTPTPTGP